IHIDSGLLSLQGLVNLCAECYHLFVLPLRVVCRIKLKLASESLKGASEGEGLIAVYEAHIRQLVDEGPWAYGSRPFTR
ncbi:hypothetical protein, partial [Fulvivirga aurantia]|uniref:hypothetical protein n=1 Tax=Fulvivirga aurantia TaxID=2529383 RepID=UPI001CA3952A